MKYELVFILSPKLAEADAKKEVEELQSKFKEFGATIEREDFWGKRKLAYEINHLSHGYYHLVVFEAENDVPGKIERQLNIEKNVIRSMIVAYEGESTVTEPGQKKTADEDKIVSPKKEKSAPAKKEKSSKDDKKEDEGEIEEKLNKILDKM